MPWPMVHFAVAAKMYANAPTPSLLLGSIAQVFFVECHVDKLIEEV